MFMDKTNHIRHWHFSWVTDSQPLLPCSGGCSFCCSSIWIRQSVFDQIADQRVWVGILSVQWTHVVFLKDIGSGFICAISLHHLTFLVFKSCCGVHCIFPLTRNLLHQWKIKEWKMRDQSEEHVWKIWSALELLYESEISLDNKTSEASD